MAASLVHIATGFRVVEDPLLPDNIFLILVHRNTPFLFDQNFRSVLRARLHHTLRREGKCSAPNFQSNFFTVLVLVQLELHQRNHAPILCRMKPQSSNRERS